MALEERDRLTERVRALLIEGRTAAGLTQKRLGTRPGRPQSFVSNYDRGAGGVGVADFVLIAKALGLDARELVGRVE